MYLGLFVHGYKFGRLLVYRCNTDMTKQDAELHEVVVTNIEEHQFEQDKEWFTLFKAYVEPFYTKHLEWFYHKTFDMDEAHMKVDSILTGVKDKRVATWSKKQKIVKIQETQVS